MAVKPNNDASFSISRKELSSLLQSKISDEILSLTGLKKLPAHIRKAIKKAGKKISGAIHSEPGEPGSTQDINAPEKPQKQKQVTNPPAKVKAAKKAVKSVNPAGVKKAAKIAKPKADKKAPVKGVATKKNVKKAPGINGTPGDKPVAQ